MDQKGPLQSYFDDEFHTVVGDYTSPNAHDGLIRCIRCISIVILVLIIRPI